MNLDGVSIFVAELMFKDIAAFESGYGAKLGCSDLLRGHLRQLGDHILKNQAGQLPDYASKSTVLAWQLECDRDQTPDAPPTEAQGIAAAAIETLRKAGRFRVVDAGPKAAPFSANRR